MGPAGFEPATFGSPLTDRGPTLLSVLSYGPNASRRTSPVKCLPYTRTRQITRYAKQLKEKGEGGREIQSGYDFFERLPSRPQTIARKPVAITKTTIVARGTQVVRVDIAEGLYTAIAMATLKSVLS